MVAGSILPVCIYKNKLYFLFGKENNNEKDAKGWSDFGGGCESNETPSGNSSNGIQIDFPLNTSGLEELSKVGGAAYINVPNQNNNKDILIIRLTETSFLAVTSICSHQGCSVQPPDTEYTNIYCACHGAEFNPESGKVVKQPTSGSATSLTSFPVKYNSLLNAITLTF